MLQVLCTIIHIEFNLEHNSCVSKNEQDCDVEATKLVLNAITSVSSMNADFLKVEATEIHAA